MLERLSKSEMPIIGLFQLFKDGKHGTGAVAGSLTERHADEIIEAVKYYNEKHSEPEVVAETAGKFKRNDIFYIQCEVATQYDQYVIVHKRTGCGLQPILLHQAEIVYSAIPYPSPVIPVVKIHLER